MSGSADQLPVRQLFDRVAIVDLTLQMVRCVDQLQWDDLRACFADDLVVDYDHVLGDEPTEVAADEFVDHWRDTVSGFEATHHLLTNHRVDVDDDEAVCTAYVQAQHFYPENCGDSLWTLGGHYRFGLGRTEDGWRIEELVMTGLWADGNQFLLERASERSPADRETLDLVEQ
jgi:hypothetical protein